MAVTLITAPVGSGKTLFCIEKIFEHLKQGRRVYANIAGLNIDEVLEVPEDWRDLPNGSVCFYDECQEHLAFSNERSYEAPDPNFRDQLPNESLAAYDRYKKAIIKDIEDKTRRMKRHYNDISQSLKISRHFGFDIYLISQSPSAVNRQTLNAVSEQFYMHRAFGLQAHTRFFWRMQQDNPSSKSARKDAEYKVTKPFNKRLYKFYNSSEQHTHKAHIPLKYILFFLIIIGLFYLAFSLLQKTFVVKPELLDMSGQTMPEDLTNFSPEKAAAAQKPASASNTTQDNYREYESARIAAVSESETYCRAYDGLGNLMPDVTDQQCRDYSSSPYKLKSGSAELKQQNAMNRGYSRDSEPSGRTALGEQQTTNSGATVNTYNLSKGS